MNGGKYHEYFLAGEREIEQTGKKNLTERERQVAALISQNQKDITAAREEIKESDRRWRERTRRERM